MENNQESYEAKLLRIIAGYAHVSLISQLAMIHLKKSHFELTDSERTDLEGRMVAEVMQAAFSLSEETVRKLLTPPPFGSESVQ